MRRPVLGEDVAGEVIPPGQQRHLELELRHAARLESARQLAPQEARRVAGPRGGVWAAFYRLSPATESFLLRLGLLHEVCSPGDLESTVAKLAAELLAGKPGAQKAAKALLEAQRSPALDDALIAETARRLTDIRGSAEAQAALADFFKK